MHWKAIKNQLIIKIEKEEQNEMKVIFKEAPPRLTFCS